MFTFKHPKYYKELRERNKSDQAISNAEATAASERAPGQGLKQQASSAKLTKHQAASSMILEPRKSFTVPGPRASTMINVLCGCFT